MDKVGPAASRLKAAGVEVFTIGLGRKFKLSQLYQVATDPYHVLTASFSSMMTLIMKLKNQICQRGGE